MRLVHNQSCEQVMAMGGMIVICISLSIYWGDDSIAHKKPSQFLKKSSPKYGCGGFILKSKGATKNSITVEHLNI